MLDGEEKGKSKGQVPKSSGALGSHVRLGLSVHEESVEGGKEVTVEDITVLSASKSDEHETEDKSRSPCLIISTSQSMLDDVLNGYFPVIIKMKKYY